MATTMRAPIPEPGLDLVNGILACSSFEQIADQLLPRLTRFFEAGSSCAFEMRRCGERKLALGRAAQIRMPVRAMADYGARFVDLDPVCAPTFGAPQDPRAVAPNACRVVRLSDRCGRGELMGSSYYNEFLCEIDVQHVFGMVVRPECDPERVLVLGFHRPKSGRDFSHELEQAAALAPALHATVERMAYRAQLASFNASNGGVPGFDAWADRARLTPREADVAREVVRGLRNVEVADALGLSLRTVENHLRSIFTKAGVRSRTQLLSRAWRSRLA